ncbi:MAG: 5-methyltetrahydropteroyltriglutamate--homocysteine S-methyltransferase, partial [Acidimicrobiales bacterium]
MPRIGPTRELKWALEGFWRGTRDAQDLLNCAAVIREANWALMAGAQVDFIPSNDFSLYDHILDMIVALGVAPARFGRRPADNDVAGRLERYFAMARGGVVNGSEVVPLELTKWFDTNYHQLVAELDPGPNFEADPAKAVAELREAADLGITTTPVLIGPLTFLLRAAMAQGSAGPWDRLEPVLACYAAILAELEAAGARWVRIDEPSLVEDRSAEDLAALRTAYRALGELSERPRIAVSTYFGHAGAALGELRGLPIDGIGLDLCAGAQNLSLLAQAGGIGDKVLFAGVIDGRNVWKADLSSCLGMLVRLQDLAEEVVASTSCSLLHVPVSLDAQKDIDPRVLPWLAFAKEKITELATLAKGVADGEESIKETLEANRAALGSRRDSPLTADARVRQALEAAPSDPRRAMAARARARAQA